MSTLKMELLNDNTTYQVEPYKHLVVKGNEVLSLGGTELNPQYYSVYFLRKDINTPVRVLYEAALIPEWMLYHMKLLDSAGGGHLIAGVGKRVGDVYWLGKNVV